VYGVSTFDLFPVFGRGRQSVGHMYPFDDEDPPFQFHLSTCVPRKPFQADSNLT